MTHTTTDDKLNMEIASLKADLVRVRKDMTDLATTLVDRGKQTAWTAGQDVKHRFETSLHTTQDFIKERPLTSAMVALGAGLLVGALISRK